MVHVMLGLLMVKFRSRTHGFNEKLGKHRGRKGRNECLLCELYRLVRRRRVRLIQSSSKDNESSTPRQLSVSFIARCIVAFAKRDCLSPELAAIASTPRAHIVHAEIWYGSLSTGWPPRDLP